jgi:SOS-response transcriptional repressor LexA
MNFSKRLTIKRHQLNFTQDDLAELIGVSRATINMWENPVSDEKYPNTNNLKKLAEVLKVEESWLRFGIGDNQPKDYKNSIELNKNIHILSDVPLVPINLISGWLKSKRKILKKGLNMSIEERKEVIFPCPIEGDSMVSESNPEKSIYDGDIAIVDPTMINNIKSGDVVIAQYGMLSDNYKLRIYRKDGTDDYLIPLNKRYNSIKVDENVRIVGKVLRIYKNLYSKY